MDKFKEKGDKSDMLTIPLSVPVKVENGGLFLSPGHGSHPDRVMGSYELIFVRSGTLSLMEKEKRFEIKAGQSLVLFPGRRHRGCDSYKPDLSFYWIHFQVAASASRSTGIKLPQVSTPARPERMAELFHRLLDGKESDQLGPHEDSLLLLLLLSEAAYQHQSSDQPDSEPSMRALAVIDRDFRKGLRPTGIARSLRLNPDYLGRIFRKAHGHTLTEAIHRRQIREARSLLRESTLNLDEVAVACGFTDTRYFRRIFHRHQGLNPRPYRKLHTRVHINTR